MVDVDVGLRMLVADHGRRLGVDDPRVLLAAPAVDIAPDSPAAALGAVVVDDEEARGDDDRGRAHDLRPARGEFHQMMW